MIGTHKERRKYPRCNAENTVKFKIFNGDEQASMTSDVSWSGMGLREVKQLDNMSWLQAQRLRHQPVIVTFGESELTARGTIVRVNHREHALGIRISSTSDDNEWRTRCHA